MLIVVLPVGLLVVIGPPDVCREGQTVELYRVLQANQTARIDGTAVQIDLGGLRLAPNPPWTIPRQERGQSRRFEHAVTLSARLHEADLSNLNPVDVNEMIRAIEAWKVLMKPVAES
jgi:hypothetical protein